MSLSDSEKDYLLRKRSSLLEGDRYVEIIIAMVSFKNYDTRINKTSLGQCIWTVSQLTPAQQYCVLAGLERHA